MERAELGVDGNCGFALLGENLQEGEAEFVEIASKAEHWTKEWQDAAGAAASRAYAKLKERLAPRTFSYYLGKSHPRYC